MNKPAKEKSDTMRLIEEGQRFLAAMETPSADDAKYWIPLLKWIESVWRECFSSPPTNAKVHLARMCGMLEHIAQGMPDNVTKLARCRRLGKGNAILVSEKLSRTVEWQSAVDEMSLKNPRMTYRNLAIRVGRLHGVSGSTVRRYCQNPRLKK